MDEVEEEVAEDAAFDCLCVLVEGAVDDAGDKDECEVREAFYPEEVKEGEKQRDDEDGSYRCDGVFS